MCMNKNMRNNSEYLQGQSVIMKKEILELLDICARLDCMNTTFNDKEKLKELEFKYFEEPGHFNCEEYFVD